jgi:hypothetical protein
MYPKLCMTAYNQIISHGFFFFQIKFDHRISFLWWSQRYRACLENELGIQSRVCLLECFDSGFVGGVFVKVRISDVVFV